MLQAAIISKPQKPEVAGILRDLIAWLEARHYNYLLDPDSAAYINAPNPIERVDLPNYKPNLVIVLGGDGTLLAAARAFARTTTPILSVNLGSLGFLTEIPRQLVATFRADGVIVSTPTGSTAYNLAADGPIVMPSVNALLVTPICPHLLTIRPIVTPGESTVSVHVVGVPNEIYLTVDGQE